MKDIKFFETELCRITDKPLRDFARYYLENYTPSYFWEIGASSSGKYHPKLAQGYGGLVRHTKAACLALEEVCFGDRYAYLTDQQKDYARVACLLHDTIKYGFCLFDKDEYKNHAENGAEMAKAVWGEWGEINTDFPYLIHNAMQGHMGKWSTHKDHRPFTMVDRAVCDADYIASRSSIDFPIISDEYDLIAYWHEVEENDLLPFQGEGERIQK